MRVGPASTAILSDPHRARVTRPGASVRIAPQHRSIRRQGPLLRLRGRALSPATPGRRPGPARRRPGRQRRWRLGHGCWSERRRAALVMPSPQSSRCSTSELWSKQCFKTRVAGGPCRRQQLTGTSRVDLELVQHRPRLHHGEQGSSPSSGSDHQMFVEPWRSHSTDGGHLRQVGPRGLLARLPRGLGRQTTRLVWHGSSTVDAPPVRLTMELLLTWQRHERLLWLITRPVACQSTPPVSLRQLPALCQMMSGVGTRVHPLGWEGRQGLQHQTPATPMSQVYSTINTRPSLIGLITRIERRSLGHEPHLHHRVAAPMLRRARLQQLAVKATLPLHGSSVAGKRLTMPSIPHMTRRLPCKTTSSMAVCGQLTRAPRQAWAPATMTSTMTTTRIGRPTSTLTMCHPRGAPSLSTKP